MNQKKESPAHTNTGNNTHTKSTEKIKYFKLFPIKEMNQIAKFDVCINFMKMPFDGLLFEFQNSIVYRHWLPRNLLIETFDVLATTAWQTIIIELLEKRDIQNVAPLNFSVTGKTEDSINVVTSLLDDCNISQKNTKWNSNE